MKDVLIFSGFHSDCRLIENGVVKPLLLGAEENSLKYNGFKDNLGEHISELNPIYCELTGQYWMWKNVESEYIGFFHYRRQMLFMEDATDIDNDMWGLVNYDVNDEDLVDKLGLDEENIRKIVKNYDLILPEKWDVTNDNSESMYHHYSKTDKLNIDDLDKAVEILLRDYPDYADTVEKSMNDVDGYFTNIFVMKKELYNEYCEWLFPILFETYEHVEDKYYNVQEYRTMGYIAEWFFNIYMNHIQIERPELNVKHLKRTMVKGEYTNLTPIKVEGKKSVPVVLCGDEYFLAYMMTTVQSMYENKDKNTYLDVIFLTNSFGVASKNSIKRYSDDMEDISIRVIELVDFQNDKMYAHINFLAMYRLRIHEILKQYDKVVYLDSDLIVKGDITELYEFDLENSPIGATPCHGFKSMYARNIPADSRAYHGNLRDYMKYYVEIKDENVDKYFNSGVLVLNLDYLRKDNFTEKLEEYYNSKDRNLIYIDQDILNYVYQDEYKKIDSEWNFVTISVNDQQTHMPAIVKKEYDKLKKTHKIVHFIGGIKPWDDMEGHFSVYSQDFWKYARNIPWYEIICRRNHMRQAEVTFERMYANHSLAQLHHSSNEEVLRLNREIEELNAKYKEDTRLIKTPGLVLKGTKRTIKRTLGKKG